MLIGLNDYAGLSTAEEISESLSPSTSVILLNLWQEYFPVSFISLSSMHNMAPISYKAFNMENKEAESLINTLRGQNRIPEIINWMEITKNESELSERDQTPKELLNFVLCKNYFSKADDMFYETIVKDGTTLYFAKNGFLIASKQEILEIMKWLAPNALPYFEAILLILMGLKCKTIEEVESIFEGGAGLNRLMSDSAETLDTESLLELLVELPDSYKDINHRKKVLQLLFKDARCAVSKETFLVLLDYYNNENFIHPVNNDYIYNYCRRGLLTLDSIAVHFKTEQQLALGWKNL